MSASRVNSRHPSQSESMRAPPHPVMAAPYVARVTAISALRAVTALIVALIVGWPPSPRSGRFNEPVSRSVAKPSSCSRTARGPCKMPPDVTDDGLPKPPLEIGGYFAGYKALGLIGQGGHACVFRVLDAACATQARSRFQHEAMGRVSEEDRMSLVRALCVPTIWLRLRLWPYLFEA
jgi:hypothetical protein